MNTLNGIFNVAHQKQVFKFTSCIRLHPMHLNGSKSWFDKHKSKK